PKRSSPSMQATDIKPGNGTCSLGQDALPETAGSRRRARKIGSGSFQRNPAGCPKGIKSQPACFPWSAQRRADTPGPARPEPYVERFGAFAKHESRSCPDFCAEPLVQIWSLPAARRNRRNLCAYAGGLGDATTSDDWGPPGRVASLFLRGCHGPARGTPRGEANPADRKTGAEHHCRAKGCLGGLRQNPG